MRAIGVQFAGGGLGNGPPLQIARRRQAEDRRQDPGTTGAVWPRIRRQSVLSNKNVSSSGISTSRE
jgi:hypothetical protein